MFPLSPMKDMQAHLETLRSQIKECEKLRDAAKGELKRATFDRIVAHYKVLASELEAAIARMKAGQE
ncbi:hypothetical protein [Bradyrhizobium sp. 195]|uniref:hypothetical protein n=1 Tax=Bradyrhizobium sp. 195 TaxID=2782662 RepID=UPI00200147A4|nr:hypothetical protein [Bradyrhizobium sp. 195]UPK31230.1 hypothetical protein IVB26_39480 [Bradyrhizobium sp. 195]